MQDEYEFWRDLARRLGAAEYFPWEDEPALNRWLLEPTGIYARASSRRIPRG